MSQAKGFSEAASCAGSSLQSWMGAQKVESLSLLKQFGLPVKLVGIGEQLGDMAEFDPGKSIKSTPRPLRNRKA